jgi:membrane dipeptidase
MTEMNRDTTKTAFGDYDFGLTPYEEARASKLHAESIICDMLYWGPIGYLSYTQNMEDELHDLFEANRNPAWINFVAYYQAQNKAIHDKLPEFKQCWDASGVTAGCRKVEFSSWEFFAAGFGWHIAMFDKLPWIIKALTADDIRRAKADGKHAVWINAQLSTGICSNFLDLLDPAYNLGLRMVQLTYNTMNLIGAGCTERTDAGLSIYGAEVIAKMNDLGIIVDTGHCGRQTTLDACELSNAPVVASHTGARGISNVARTKTDEEIKAIARTGGVIGVYTVPFFLSSVKKANIENMLDHIDYIVNAVGWEHTGIGTDWPLSMPKSIQKRSMLPWALKAGHRAEDGVNEVRVLENLKGFDDYRDFPNITRGLVKRGYKDNEIKGILGENFLRVAQQVWK